MKARVKATGEIVDATYYTSANGIKYYDIGNSDYTMMEDELDFDFSYTPDYWTRLEHQYAGMAMQGIVMNEKMQEDLYKAFGKNESMDVTISECAIVIAHTLVEKLKEKEERK
jgi:hypothetical protein